MYCLAFENGECNDIFYTNLGSGHAGEVCKCVKNGGCDVQDSAKTNNIYRLYRPADPTSEPTEQPTEQWFFRGWRCIILNLAFAGPGFLDFSAELSIEENQGMGLGTKPYLNHCY